MREDAEHREAWGLAPVGTGLGYKHTGFPGHCIQSQRLGNVKQVTETFITRRQKNPAGLLLTIAQTVAWVPELECARGSQCYSCIQLVPKVTTCSTWWTLRVAWPFWETEASLLPHLSHSSHTCSNQNFRFTLCRHQWLLKKEAALPVLSRGAWPLLTTDWHDDLSWSKRTNLKAVLLLNHLPDWASHVTPLYFFFFCLLQPPKLLQSSYPWNFQRLHNSDAFAWNSKYFGRLCFCSQAVQLQTLKLGTEQCSLSISHLLRAHSLTGAKK